MASYKVVTDQNIGAGLKIAATKLQADLGAGLMFNGNAIAADPATLPLTVTLANPSAANLQAGVNGNLSNLLDLTALVQTAETTTSLTYNPATKALTYTNEDGVVATIDLSALAMDIYVNGASYNASSMVLTLTDNDASTPDIVINLADLKQVVTAASSVIAFSGTGEASSPLQATLNLDTATGNLLSMSVNGLLVTINQGIGISGDGTPGSPLEFAADELPLHFENTGDPNNAFVMSTLYRPAGTRVSMLDAATEVWTAYIQNAVDNVLLTAIPATVNAMLTVDVQDLAGTHLFYALP